MSDNAVFRMADRRIEALQKLLICYRIGKQSP